MGAYLLGQDDDVLSLFDDYRISFRLELEGLIVTKLDMYRYNTFEHKSYLSLVTLNKVFCHNWESSSEGLCLSTCAESSK